MELGIKQPTLSETHKAEIKLSESINRISDLNTKVPTTGSHM